MRTGLRSVDQLGFDEQNIDDAEIENALELRDKRRNSLGAVRAEYTEAHAAAVALLTRLELPEGGVARVGRFRITRSSVAGRSVTFETQPTTRISITPIDE